MRQLKKLITIILLCPLLFIYGCGVINVSGKTFRFHKVTIDWGLADNDTKQTIFDENQVKDEQEFLAVLKTRNNRDTRFTTFGTDNKYTTKNNQNEILDSGYYKQDESVITLADTVSGLSESGAYTLIANEKGYIVTVKLNDEWKVFAQYHYTEQE